MTWVTGFQKWLSESQSLQNAQMVANHFGGSWADEAICALCGNMRHESSINPDMYEYGYQWGENRGYGLVQWTPRTKYWDWAVTQGLDPRHGDSQLSRIDFEQQNNIQYIANGHRRRYGKEDKYNFSFPDFVANSHNLSVAALTEAFMWNYEGPNYTAGLNSLSDRQAFANLCYSTLDLSGGGGGIIVPPSKDITTNEQTIYHLWLSNALNGGV
jgi:Phage tail lysozyme